MEFKNVFTMKQPDLGKKILELRKQKGFTQEELVEKCNINVRTIQRIEAGDVTPRSFTIKTILEALGMDAGTFFEDSIHEENKIYLSDKDHRILNTSWITGVFYLILTIIGAILEIYFLSSERYSYTELFYRIPYSILFLLSMWVFLRGYKTLGELYNNSFLINSVYIYFVIGVLMSLINILLVIFNEGEWSTDIFSGVILVILFGISELFLGVGIYKLKANSGNFAQIVGILKIVNGAMLITVILSPISIFLAIPILILEVIFLYTASAKENY